jgi:lipase
MENELALKAVQVDDATIPYLLYDGPGPTLVLLHATGFLPWLWHPIARELKSQFRIIAPYYCDHRSADPDAGGFSWLELAEDLSRFCQRLDIRQPFMAGHSMGGAIMALAAGKFEIDVRKLVLIEPIFLPRELYQVQLRVEDHPLAGKSIKRRNYWESSAAAKAYLQSKPLFAAWDEEMLDLYVEYGMMPSKGGGLELACHPRREAALFMGSLAYDPWPVLEKVTCPVLVLEGERTENKGFIDQEKAARSFPNGRYLQIKDAGHLIPMEKPGEIARIMHGFFRDGE